MKGSWTTPAEGADPTVGRSVGLGLPGAVLLGRGLCGLSGKEKSWLASR